MSLICFKAKDWDNNTLVRGTDSRTAKQACEEYFSAYGYDGKLQYMYSGKQDVWEVRHRGTEIRAYIIRYDVDKED